MKNWLFEVNVFVRSLVFSILTFCTMIIYSFLSLLAMPLPLKYRHTLIRSYLIAYMFLLNKICLIQYDIQGLENIPQGRTGVILSKHQSTWETFYLPIIFHTPAIILKRELLWMPFFGWGLAITDPIAINRRNTTSAMSQIITKGKKCMEAGRWILVFPEGTRVPYGQVGHYRLGGARLAEATEAPVLPVAHNAGQIWPKKKFMKYPGTIHLVIGPVIESKGRKAEEILQLAKHWIETTVARIDGFIDKPAS